MTGARILGASAPLPFIAGEVGRLATPGAALDVACGRGRHVALLADAGWRVTGVDRSRDALTACAVAVPGATLIEWDVEAHPERLGGGPWDLVVTTFFLHRPLIPWLHRWLRPGGTWLLETFHLDNHLRRGHPRRAALCLAPGEAAALATAAGFEIVTHDEGERGEHATVRLAARRGLRGT